MPAKLKSRIPEIIAQLAEPKPTLRQGVDAIAEGAKARVPVGTRHPHLRDAIHVEEAKGGYEVVAGDTEAFYGHMVEFGTTHSPAEPFLLPAFEAQKEAILAAVAGRLRKL